MFEPSSKADRLVKARAVKAQRAQERAEAKLEQANIEKLSKIAKAKERLPQVSAEYDALLNALSKEKSYDPTRWNQLDRLQAAILGYLRQIDQLERGQHD